MAAVTPEVDRRVKRRIKFIDGLPYYSCRACAALLPIISFYLRANGRPYSYCKACDKARAMVSGRRARELRRRAREYKAKETERAAADHDRRVRWMLVEALVLLQAHVPWADVVREIDEYLGEGR